MSLRPDLTEKFWKKVIEALDDIYNVQSYYAGGTLCIDINNDICYCLNLDGRGFVINKQSRFNELRFYQPEVVLDKVKKIYVDVKRKEESYVVV
jgi:hypothetical protein